MKNYLIYRFYDSSDDLLYVGITNDLNRRLAEHGSEKAWFGDVVHVKVSPDLLTRDKALEVEWATINECNPKHNVARNPDGCSEEFRQQLGSIVEATKLCLNNETGYMYQKGDLHKLEHFTAFTRLARNNADFWGRPSILKREIYDAAIEAGWHPDVALHIVWEWYR